MIKSTSKTATNPPSSAALIKFMSTPSVARSSFNLSLSKTPVEISFSDSAHLSL